MTFGSNRKRATANASLRAGKLFVVGATLALTTVLAVVLVQLMDGADGSGDRRALSSDPDPRSSVPNLLGTDADTENETDTGTARENEVFRPHGYAGTKRVRRSVSRRHTKQRASSKRNLGLRPRGPHVAADALPAAAAQLARTGAYPTFLVRLAALGVASASIMDDAAMAPGGDAPERWTDERERLGALLGEALEDAPQGAARQSLIFHLAITLPLAEARIRLAPYLGRADDDAEDALCALAFAGDAEALERFEELARTPSVADVAQDLRRSFDMARAAATLSRGVLRSYRCIEALDRSPYFEIHAMEYDGLHETFPWAAPRERDAEITRRTLEAWIARYPDHSGADDMMFRVARIHRAAGRDIGALRWASRCATARDGDMREAGLKMMVALVEFAPPDAPITRVAVDPTDPGRNAELLHYVRLRRRAADSSFALALADLAQVARMQPELQISRAYRERWAAPLSRALDSGSAPLAVDDPLRRVAVMEIDETQAGRWSWRAVDRPPLAGPTLPSARLRAQFRAWETMAELERRESSESGDARVDLLYKRAAFYYYQRDVLYPVYARHSVNYSRRPAARFVFDVAGGEAARAWGQSSQAIEIDRAWLTGVVSWNHATALFEEVTRTAPAHPLADDALFSAAMSQIKAADSAEMNGRSRDHPSRNAHIATAMGAFERLVDDYPKSHLRPDAAAALAYWRAARPELLPISGTADRVQAK